jgi:Flp pilus assembly protein TadG
MGHRWISANRGAVQAAMTFPIVLVVVAAIADFSRAYQTWQVLTTAAREGARVAIHAGATRAEIEQAVIVQARSGSVMDLRVGDIAIDQNVALGARTGSQVTIQYPYRFLVLSPVARLVSGSSITGTPMTAVAIMPNDGY